MSLYTKQVIINPINLWLSGRNYFVGNTVENGAVFFRCKLDNTASGANEPPNITFWDSFVPTNPNSFILRKNYSRKFLFFSFSLDFLYPVYP